MKRVPYRLARRGACFSVGLGLILAGSLHAQITTLIDCPEAVSADRTSRGFYVPNYPGSSINSVKIYMGTGTGGGTHPYQISITARQGAYDGPVLASGFASVTLDETADTEVNVQMATGGGTNPPVPPGATVAFVLGVNKNPDAPDPFYAIPPFEGGCPEVVQTNGTDPPLSSFRRNGVKIQITGNKFLDVGPGQSIQLAIDNADPGDTVTVAPGSYNEDLTLRSEVDLQGPGPDQATLTGTGSGSVITAGGINNMELSGFTVQGSGSDDLDAGLLITNSDIVVRNNTFTGNTLGIRTNDSHSFICSNLITGNGNPAPGRIDYGVYCSGNDLFSGNRIVQNVEGGVLCVGSSAAPQFINNTIADNPSRGLQAAGASVILKNNILFGTSSGQGIFSENDAVVESTYNCLFANSTNYSTVRDGTITSKLGDILVDPVFDPAQPGAYVLDESSPCIDAGDPAAIYNDLDGSRNDIGATGGLCGQATPPGSILSGFVWTSVGTYANITEIEQSGPKRGLTTDRDRPFGGRPWLYGAFGNTDTPVARYAVKVAKWSGGSPPAPGDFEYRDDPLSKTRYDISSGMVVAETVAVGPTILGGKPVYSLTRNSGNIFWAHENLRLKLDTGDLDGNGIYSIRMEALDFLGSQISLAVNEDLVIRVNNTRPEAEINAVSFNGGPPFDECSIIDLPSETSTLDFVITATHPDGFLDNYRLVAEVGRNRSGGVITSDSYSSHVAPDAIWTGVTTLSVPATPVSPEQPLPNLQLWETCAYQFRISAWARTTNGFHRIYRDTFFDNHAIDLDGTNIVCTPDLDNDGDVDGDDLAIMAAAYGTAP